ncbi:hypothetical protein MF406_01950 [Georgenia sp. TF02-10]|uniref:hypothetical protein n=1 Tax=Georgenia sp. TF02-10 TaxID=2917725 RepID=UPI001FA747D9|nr:hypothetical protein [Georgenia sp. TF02-10]UNX55073.1 hypothetical protein MF406_01950 [Georgenia sp. TF02-10]
MTPVPADVTVADIGDAVAQLLLVGGVMLVVLTAALAGTTWLVVRRVRRSRRLRRGMDRGRLVVGTVMGDDAGRRLARMRLEVQRSLDAVERSLGAARAQQRPMGDLPSVAAHLQRAGEQLDAELRLAEREPDRELKTAWASWLADQVRDHTRLAADLRRTLHRTGLAADNHHLQRAGDHLALEVQALRVWDSSYRRGRTV